MNRIDLVEQSRLRADRPAFRPGDTVRVHVKVREGSRERVQVFQGVVISRRGGGLRESFTVRKISFGVGVERTFPLHSPVVDAIEIVQHGRARRAKLYYLRERTGRHAKIRERRTRIPAEVAAPAAVAAGEAAAGEAAAGEAAAGEATEAAADKNAGGAPADLPAGADATAEPEAEKDAAAEEQRPGNA